MIDFNNFDSIQIGLASAGDDTQMVSRRGKKARNH